MRPRAEICPSDTKHKITMPAVPARQMLGSMLAKHCLQTRERGREGESERKKDERVYSCKKRMPGTLRTLSDGHGGAKLKTVRLKLMDIWGKNNM